MTAASEKMKETEKYFKPEVMGYNEATQSTKSGNQSGNSLVYITRSVLMQVSLPIKMQIMTRKQICQRILGVTYDSCLKSMVIKHAEQNNRKAPSVKKIWCLLRQTSKAGNNRNKKLYQLYMNAIALIDLIE
jgi:hypothetical protein